MSREIDERVAVEIFGWIRPPEAEVKCPECGAGANRQKCMWEMGGSCPRHDAQRDYERSRNPLPYSSDPAASELLQAEMRSRKRRLTLMDSGDFWLAEYSGVEIAARHENKYGAIALAALKAEGKS